MPARRTVRDGNPGKIVHVAPKGGYDRFIPDEYRHHHGKERKYTK